MRQGTSNEISMQNLITFTSKHKIAKSFRGENLPQFNFPCVAAPTCL